MDRYWALVDKVNTFFTRVSQRYPRSLACASGCSDCCQSGLSVTAVEAHAITTALLQMDAEQRDKVHVLSARKPGSSCSALDEHGRCSIYQARPIVCRSHGVVLKFKKPGALPVLDCCPLNFADQPLDGVDADCVLDQDTISTLLAAVNQLFCQGQTAERQDLRDLLQRSAGSV